MQMLPAAASSAAPTGASLLPPPPAASGAVQGLPATGPVLRDIHMPAEPSWWPPAPGWWVLLALLLLLGLALVWWQRRRQRRQQWRARVLIELDEAELRFRQGGDRHRLAGELHALLRRAAAGLDPAALSARGSAWEAVLDRVRVDAATRAQLLALDQAMYQRDGGQDFDAAASIAAVRRWMTLVLRKLAVEHAGRYRRLS